MIAILAELDKPETMLEWALAFVHGATALRPEECLALKWCDIDWDNDQILVRRAWSKGKETEGKTTGSMSPVAMHPLVARYLNEWRKAVRSTKKRGQASIRQSSRKCCAMQSLKPRLDTFTRSTTNSLRLKACS
jgi:integrase